MEIKIPFSFKTEVLALGAQSKSAFCFAKDNTFYLFETGGDLGDLENLRNYEKKIKAVQKRLKIKPRIIACDLHPDYVSTKFAQEWLKAEGSRLKAVQHHEAHVASCIVDNNIKGKVIGVAFDGTGFGSDGNIWGGEFFVGTIKGFKRVAHLKYIPMPGGEAAIREPWRVAFSYMYSVYGKERLLRPDRKVGTRNDILRQMIDKNINSPLTSSMGRLFDAVSSLVGICDRAKYEGQAAVELEKTLSTLYSLLSTKDRYNFSYKNQRDLITIDWAPVIKGIVKDLETKKTQAEISLKFHNAVCHMIKDVCKLLRKKYNINKVCMSGGVFQNRYLTYHIGPILESEGFEAYLHKNFPSHDANIALGQAILSVQG